MAQIFTPAADTWLRATTVATIFLLTLGAFFFAGYVNSDYATGVGMVIDQPVPFSHKHHVGDLGIDCRMCHTGVETSANAGLPPTHTCMTCHSQLWTGAAALAPVRQSLAEDKPLVWNRVAEVPNYVFFNHAIHVNRGVPCVACHGRVDEMPLTRRAHPFLMRFCTDCHRDPGPSLRPPGEVTRMDWAGWDAVPEHRRYGVKAMKHFGIDPSRLINCETCHR
jgi:hypothetical protein